MDKLDLVAVVFSMLSLVLSLFVLVGVPTDYSELDGLPDLFEVGDIPVVDLMHGLCLWLPFDGVAFDKSGFRYDAVVGGAVYSDGFFGKGLLLDGVDDYVNVTFLGSVSEFTFSFWVKLDDTGWLSDGNNIVLFSSLGGYIYCGFTDELYFQYYSAGWRSSNMAVSVGSWSNVVLAMNSTGGYFYVNSTYCGFDSSVFSLQSFMVLGQRSDAIGVPFSLYGCLDDVRFYNRVLSSYEISALYGLGV